MTRVNLLLLLGVIATALYLVRVQYESRQLVAQIERAQSEARRLEDDREQLEAAKRTQAASLRVEKLAKEKLNMRLATPAITHYVTYPPAVLESRP